MTNLRTLHPDEAQLLRFCDGELPAREATGIERHLEACWECRTQVEDIQKTIGDYVRYRRDAVQPGLPPPPKPWRDIRSQFERGGTVPRSPWFPRLLYAAAAAVVVCAAIYRFNTTPSVRAAELLEKAAVAERRDSGRVHRLRIRTRTRTLTRAATQESQGDSDLEALFASAHYSWENPLSAEAYAAWRNQLTEKRDEVRATNTEYVIRTSTSSGALAEATMELRKEDLRPIRETLQFRNQEWVEISEAPDVPVLEGASKPEPQPSSREIKSPGKLMETMTPGDELKVIIALHDAGADLGEPIEVTRTADRILVNGTGLGPERKKQIQAALEPLPNVELHFLTPETAAPRRAESNRQVVSGATPFEEQLRERLGGSEAFSKFADHVLERSDAMMARAHALRKLAERFPPEIEAQLSLADRRVLTTLRAEHAQMFSGEVSQIEKSMKPILAELGTPAHRQSASLQRQWQPATLELWTSAQSVDRGLGSLLAGSTQAGIPVAQSIAKALGQLEAETASYLQLTEAAKAEH